MIKNQVWEKAPDEALEQTGSRWFATFTGTVPAHLPGHRLLTVGGHGGSRNLYLGSELGRALPICAEQADASVIFDGALFNRRELRAELGDLVTLRNNDAELILKAYLKWGEGALKRLRGTFALIIRDNPREALLCLRDPLGSHPLFYAEGGGELLLSPSIEVLLGQPHVSRALSRPVLVDYLADRFSRLEETFYEAVRRVPPRHVLRIGREGCHSFCYWDPSPDGTVKWLTPGEVEEFDYLLERAVSRCLDLGPAGIFLSGGIDSVAVAAVAAKLSRTQGMRKPSALSLIFPDPVCNEEVVQRSVAAQLGLPQVVKPFFEATGVNGLLAPAFLMSSTLAAPLKNVWLPAFYQLALEGKRRGCQAVLTGGGGDEWLGVSLTLAADLLRDFDFAGLFRLWQSGRRSFRASSLTIARNLLWNFGVVPLVVPPAHRFVKQVAPWALKLRRRLSPWPAPWDCPKWLARDAELQRQFDLRREDEEANKGHTSGSLYVRQMRRGLDHPLVSWMLEETFEVYQRAGLRILQPFCDPDLLDMLFRTPPFLLIQGGRTKGLVRSSLARRFPTLGFERQRKVEGTSFFASLVYKDAREIWGRLGGAQTLADLGIINEKILSPGVEQLLAQHRVGELAYRLWSVLNLETWARAHVS
jgi:asparagine synthetase B (glutamine-hydrolysing)